jgi:SAM-dependent methyltransferase
MNTELLRENLQHPKSRHEIIQEICCGKSVLDIGCVNHVIENSHHDNWLHGKIVEVASFVLGVDFLENEIKELALRGFNVISADVNFPLPIERKFDIILVGNLIEHLSSFSGLMKNINQLLSDDGFALISTANPFFREQYFYSALKNDIIVNPEHTCWIDPVTLDQLSRRFGLETVEVLWIKEKWKLSDTYFNGNKQSLDGFSGRWSFLCPPSFLEKLITPLLIIAFHSAVSRERKKRIKYRYQDQVSRMLYLKLKGALLEVWWRLRRLSIPNSPINNYELYFSVIKKIKND